MDSEPIAGVQAFVLSMSPGIDTTLLIREFQNVGQLRSYLRRHSGDPMAAAAKLRDKIRFSAELAGAVVQYLHQHGWLRTPVDYLQYSPEP
jgi:hypothetical protein